VLSLINVRAGRAQQDNTCAAIEQAQARHADHGADWLAQPGVPGGSMCKVLTAVDHGLRGQQARVPL
jgi:hypothetical protein